MMVKLKIKSAALATAAAAAANNGPPPVPATPAQAQPSKPKKTPKPPKDKSTTSTSTKSAVKTPAESKSKKHKVPKSSAKVGGPSSGTPSAVPSSAPSYMPPTTPGVPKIRLKTSGSSVSAASTPVPITKPTRPTLKLTSSSFNAAAAGAGPTSAPVATPTIKLRTKTKPTATRKRRHEPGNGYDSEASDREDDPAIEEQFILRMPPGSDCDYLREVIERKELSVTSDVWLKFKDQRRAVVNVRGHLYSACLVDLPCVIEANKTLDKKQIFKTADICQMLLVGDRIQHEDEAWNVSARLQDITFPHGLTPPMQHVRRRRFRKRISNRTIEAVEAEVDRLLRDDEAAKSSKFDLIDHNELAREGTISEDEGAEEGYDLLGEAEYDFGPDDAEGEMDEDMLANDLESALMADDEPAAAAEAPSATQLESDDSDEDEEEEAPVQRAPQMDEATREAAQRRSKLLEEIEDLKEALASKEKEYLNIGNVMLKARVGKTIAGFRDELDVKHKELAQLGG
ncbi:TAFII55 protein conserved region-domain-containing protein [Geopyxis carbonaria]|nr:TAFII55 protein conserved region-domain-containing protein [Geopyxis carbonaria]